MNELVFVLGIHLSFIFSTIVLIVVEHFRYKLREAETLQSIPAIKSEVIYKTFDAKTFKSSVKLSVYDLEANSIRRIKKHLALQILDDVEGCITFERFPTNYEPYGYIEATLITGVQKCET